MESLKRSIGYFCSVVFYGFVIYEGLKIQLYLREQTAINYNPWPPLVFSVVFPVLIGIIFSLQTSVRELKGKGSLQVDWVILYSITLPTLILAASPSLYFTPLGKLIPFVTLFPKNSDPFFFLVGLVSGYSMIKSIKKSRHNV